MSESRVALVTGGSRGIGRAVVLRLAAAGYDIAFCYRSREADAADVVLEVEKYGRRALAIQADVADPDAVGAFVRRGEDELGPVSAVVTSAGITRDASLVTMSDENWQAVTRTGLDGTFHVCRAAVFGMLKRRRGSVVTLSSVAGVSGNAGQTNYSAAKAGVIGLSMALAKEVGRFGIRVNAVAPGFIDTDMTAAMSPTALKSALGRVVLGRLGTAGEVADLVEFLASDRASYITGQVFKVDGGMAM